MLNLARHIINVPRRLKMTEACKEIGEGALDAVGMSEVYVVHFRSPVDRIG
jgi:hypothetical protein